MKKPPEIERDSFEKAFEDIRVLLKEPDEHFQEMVREMEEYPLEIPEENLMTPEEDPVGLKKIPGGLTLDVEWDSD